MLSGSPCGLIEPGFEMRLADSCVIARKQCSLADFRSTVTGVWISDHFPGIFEGAQASPNEFIHAKLLRPRDFDNAVYWLTYCHSGHATCDIVGGHRLEKHRRQMHLVANHGNIGKTF